MRLYIDLLLHVRVHAHTPAIVCAPPSRASGGRRPNVAPSLSDWPAMAWLAALTPLAVGTGDACCMDGAVCMDPLSWQLAANPSTALDGAFLPWERTLTSECSKYGANGRLCLADQAVGSNSHCCSAMCGECTRVSNEPPVDECFTRPDGSDYRGTIANTVTGRQCAPWSTVAGYNASDYPLSGLGAQRSIALQSPLTQIRHLHYASCEYI